MEEQLPPHVLIFPLPMLGHVNSMLKLAELFFISGLHVTVLLSEHNHSLLLRQGSLNSLLSRYNGFQSATISDGLPDDHPRSGKRTMDIMMRLMEVGESQLRNLMVSTDWLSKSESGDGVVGLKRRPVTCIVIDGVMGFATKVSEEMGIPFIYIRTCGACSFWANFSIPEVINADEIPLRGKNEDKASYQKRKEMDLPVTSVPGMEGILRRRDLPVFFRVDDVNDTILQTIKTETRKTTKARALILNTFEDLEGPVLDQIRKQIPKLFSIGPLHAHLKARIAANPMEGSARNSGSFWEEDRSCIVWLDSQPHKSVIFVSFGSVAVLTRDELLEFWHGLVNSGQRFLWVMRPDSVIGKSDIPAELEEGTKARGYIVGWAPQEEILAHPAISGFLTHAGWNSTLESITAGVPMICWPCSADQPTNSRFVSDVWKIGLDMKDTCDRVIVEKMVRELMEVRNDEFLDKAEHMSNLARKALSKGGSSSSNLDSLIEFIRSMIA